MSESYLEIKSFCRNVLDNGTDAILDIFEIYELFGYDEDGESNSQTNAIHNLVVWLSQEVDIQNRIEQENVKNYLSALVNEVFKFNMVEFHAMKNKEGKL